MSIVISSAMRVGSTLVQRAINEVIHEEWDFKHWRELMDLDELPPAMKTHQVHVDRIDQFLKKFPDAKIVVPYRNYKDTLISQLLIFRHKSRDPQNKNYVGKSKKGDPRIYMPLREAEEKGLSDLEYVNLVIDEHPDLLGHLLLNIHLYNKCKDRSDVIAISYESILADPDLAYRDLFDKLGLEGDAKAIAKKLSPVSFKAHPDEEMVAVAGRWHSWFTEERNDKVEAVWDRFKTNTDFKESVYPKNTKICSNKLGSYCVPNSSIHEGCGEVVSKGEVYECCTLHFIRDNCDDDDVIHAGSFFGNFLPSISNSCRGTVWAFEPVKENFRCSDVTIKLNGLENVTLTNAGLGNEDCKLEIQTGRSDGTALGGSCRIGEIEEGCSFETVKVVKLDDVISEDRRISIMQLDVEGFEADALAGALEIIDRCHPILIIRSIDQGQYKPYVITESEWYKENIFSRGYEVADFQGVVCDLGYMGRIHGNIVLCHPNRPWKKYFDQTSTVK